MYSWARLRCRHQMLQLIDIAVVMYCLSNVLKSAAAAAIGGDMMADRRSATM